MSTIGDLFDRWKAAKGFTTEAEACLSIGIPLSTLAVWREGGPAQIEHIERMAGDVGTDRESLWKIIASSMKEAEAWHGARAAAAPAEEPITVIDCESFSYPASTARHIPIDALADLRAWRMNNQDVKVINVETILGAKGGHYGDVELRPIGLRVWFERLAKPE